MCLAQGPQRSDACEIQTRGPSVSSQALYQWAAVLPYYSRVKSFLELLSAFYISYSRVESFLELLVSIHLSVTQVLNHF